METGREEPRPQALCTPEDPPAWMLPCHDLQEGDATGRPTGAVWVEKRNRTYSRHPGLASSVMGNDGPIGTMGGVRWDDGT